MADGSSVLKQSELELQIDLYQKLQAACMPNIGKKSEKSMVSLMYPGITIHKEDYVIKGSEYTEEMYGLVDPILDIDIIYNETSKKLSSEYRDILEANGPKQGAGENLTPEEIEVDNYLKQNVTEYGNFVEKYNKAKGNYENGHSRTDKRAMDLILKQWKVWGKSEYEEKLELRQNMGDVGKYRDILKALEVLEDCEYNGNIYRCSFLPSQLVDENTDLSWVEVKLNKKTRSDSSSTRMEEMARVEKKFGLKKDTRNIFARLFAPRAPQREEKGQTESKEMIEKISESCDVDSMEISFEVARVQVQRRWLDGSLFLKLLSQKEEKDRERIGFIEGIMVARNIHMRMEVSREAAEQLRSRKDTPNSGGMVCGPFSIDFKTNIYINENDMKSGEGRVSVEVKTGDSRQIIGFINTLLEERTEA